MVTQETALDLIEVDQLTLSAANAMATAEHFVAIAGDRVEIVDRTQSIARLGNQNFILRHGKTSRRIQVQVCLSSGCIHGLLAEPVLGRFGAEIIF